MKYILLFLLFALNPLQAAAKGKMDGDRYNSLNGLFSIKAPKMLDGVKITDLTPSDHHHFLSFVDNWGNVIRVEVLTSTSTINPKQLFYNEIFEPLLSENPLTKLVFENEEFLAPIGQSYVAFLDTSHEERLDSKRLYLVSFAENHAIIISTQESPLSNFSRKLTGAELASNLTPMVEKLLETRLSYQKKK